MTITGQSSLDKDDIDRMVRDAEAHAEEDRRRKDEADTRNQADTLVYQTEKLLRDNADKIDAAEKSKVETAVGGLKESLAGTDVEAIKRGTEQLMQVSQGFAQRLYEAASQQQRPPGRRRLRPAALGDAQRRRGRRRRDRRRARHDRHRLTMPDEQPARRRRRGTRAAAPRSRRRAARDGEPASADRGRPVDGAPTRPRPRRGGGRLRRPWPPPSGRDDYLDALRRLQADFENFKKRTMKQQTDLLERAAQSLVDKLLPRARRRRPGRSPTAAARTSPRSPACSWTRW